MNSQKEQRINYCKTWLIGDRCDGWAKQKIQKELDDLENNYFYIHLSYNKDKNMGATSKRVGHKNIIQR